MAYGQSYIRVSQQRSDAIKAKKENVLNEALTMETNNKHILALRKELAYYKQCAEMWENEANENDKDINDILNKAGVETIPDLLNKLT